jgi:hypothetical protein
VDFACEPLATRRGIRILAAVNASTRECLTLGVDTSLSSPRVIRALEQTIAKLGLTESIRCTTGRSSLAAFPGLVRGAEDPVDPHSAEQPMQE